MPGDLFASSGYVPGVWTYAALLEVFPAGVVAAGVSALTTDAGPVISDGQMWFPYALVKPNRYTEDHVMAAVDVVGVVMDKATPNTLTVPPSSEVYVPPGFSIAIEQHGAGQTTVAKGGAGVEIRSRGNLMALAGQWACASLRYQGDDEWVLCGDLA